MGFIPALQEPCTPNCPLVTAGDGQKDGEWRGQGAGVCAGTAGDLRGYRDLADGGSEAAPTAAGGGGSDAVSAGLL